MMNKYNFSFVSIILSTCQMQVDLRRIEADAATSKIQHSSEEFRDLMRSLREKYDQKNQRYSQQNMSLEQKDNQIKSVIEHIHNPQQQDSVIKKGQNSSEINLRTQTTGFITDRHSFRIKMEQSDDTLRLKPKGSVNGRDALIKSPFKFSTSLQSHYIAKPQFSPKVKKRSRVRQQKASQQKYLALNNSSLLPKIQRVQRNESNITKLSSSQKFRQHKLNSQMAKSIKITNINERSILQYCKMQYLDEKSQAKEIFSFFNQLCRIANYYIEYPLIKKYKNCVYFGRPIINEQKYQGFLYYFDRKLYFGEFLNGQRSGQGVQINFQSDFIFKGFFRDGMKTGKFQVNKRDQKYIGDLINGAYHGIGKLVTKDSIYQGDFRDGQKHGKGAQVFTKTGLKLTGTFYHNYFDTKAHPTQVENIFNKSKRINNELYSVNSLRRGISQSLQYQPRIYEIRQSQINRKILNSESFEQGPQVYGINIVAQGYKNRQYLNEFQQQANMRKRNKWEIHVNDDKTNGRFRRTSNSFNQNIKNSNRMSYGMSKSYEQFENSFDVHSRQDTQLSNGPINVKDRFEGFQHKMVRRQFGGNLEMIEERMETTQFQDPLPMPAFLK